VVLRVLAGAPPGETALAAPVDAPPQAVQRMPRAKQAQPVRLARLGPYSFDTLVAPGQRPV